MDAEPARITAKRASLRAAIAAGVTICNGSDVGVFTHGDNAREPELLVSYGMSPLQAMRAATSVTARAIGLADPEARLGFGYVMNQMGSNGAAHLLGAIYRSLSS